MKKKIIFIVLGICVVTFVAVVIASTSGALDKYETTTNIILSTTQKSTTVSTTKEHSSVKKDYSYDDLQKIFLSITPKTTLDDFVKTINKYDVEEIHQEYNAMDRKHGRTEMVYKVAYDSYVALHSHAETGDYVYVTFYEDNSLKDAEYFNANAWHHDDYDVYSAFLETNDSSSIIGKAGYFGKYFKSPTESDYKEFNSGNSVVNYIIDNAEKYTQTSNNE